MNLLNEHYWEHRAKVSEVALEGVFATLINLVARVGGDTKEIEALQAVRDNWRKVLVDLEAIRPQVELPKTLLDTINQVASMAATRGVPKPKGEAKTDPEPVSLLQVRAMLARHLSIYYIEDGDPLGFLPSPAYATPVGHNVAMIEPHGTVTKLWLQQPPMELVTITIRAGNNGIAFSPDQVMFRLGVDNWQVWEEDTVVVLDLDDAEIELIHFIETFNAGIERMGG